jgi:hypothetical protein
VGRGHPELELPTTYFLHLESRRVSVAGRSRTSIMDKFTVFWARSSEPRRASEVPSPPLGTVCSARGPGKRGPASARMSRPKSAKDGQQSPIARPAEVVRSSASVSDAKPTLRCSSSWGVTSGSARGRLQPIQAPQHSIDSTPAASSNLPRNRLAARTRTDLFHLRISALRTPRNTARLSSSTRRRD